MTVQIQGLTKRYPNGVQALDAVSLTIRPGLFGLLGPNGAGKSTLMRTLATLQEADSGTARLGDLDLLRDKDGTRRVLGYLPQEFGLYPKVSAVDLLDHLATLKGITNAKERKEIVEGLLQKTNLFDVRKRALGTYSGGMKQRFGIAQALLGDPRLVIVDEPTAGLDPEERVRFHNLLGGIGEDVVVILSTHIVSDVTDLCREMAILHQGKVRMTGDPVKAIDSLQGRIWQKTIERAELAAHEAKHQVVSTRLYGGRTRLHVFSDARPDASFDAVTPDLEDVYFAVIKGFQTSAGERSAA